MLTFQSGISPRTRAKSKAHEENVVDLKTRKLIDLNGAIIGVDKQDQLIDFIE